MKIAQARMNVWIIYAFIYFLIGIFLFQVVKLLEFYWLEETYEVVKYSLLIVWLIEIIPRISYWLRLVLQVITIVWINAYILQVTFPDKISVQYMARYFMEMDPFIWFALLFAFVYSFLMRFIHSKPRVLALMFIGIIGFSIVDSYAEPIVWPLVSWMIIVGLLLLVLFHALEVKALKREGSSIFFADYPIVVSLLLGLFIAGFVYIGSLAPPVDPLLKDPYTAWKNWKGEDAVKLGGDFGKFTNAGERNRSSSSGYSRDDRSLGGGFEFDYSVIFHVESNHPSYWRGETRGFYNGEGWERIQEEQNRSSESVTLGEPFVNSSFFAETIDVTQTFTFENNESYPVIFGAYSIDEIKNVATQDELMQAMYWSESSATLYWSELADVEYPSSYVVQSTVPLLDEEMLNAVPELDSFTRQRLLSYLQVPADLPERVRDLAIEITADATTPYEQAVAIETYLRKTYPYTNRPDETNAVSEDFVDRFLFEVQEGYCDHYSSAMVMLARTVGLPTRWVKGFATGTSSQPFSGFMAEEEMTSVAGETTRYTVRNADAHSWAEVFFEGIGWIPFEPTAGFTLPQFEASEDEELAEEEPIIPNEEPKEVLPAEATNENKRNWLLISLLIIMSLIAGVLIVRKVWGRLKMNQSFGAEDSTMLLQRKMRVLFKSYARKGLSRDRAETLRESFSRWEVDSTEWRDELIQFAILYEKFTYSPESLTNEEQTEIMLIMDKLQARLKNKDKQVPALS